MDQRIVWCGNLTTQVTEELLLELFLQVGPIEKVCIRKNRDGISRNYALITFKHEVSVPYAIKVLNGTSLFGCNLFLKSRCTAALNQAESTQSNNKPQPIPVQIYHGQHHRSHSMPVVPVGMFLAQEAADMNHFYHSHSLLAMHCTQQPSNVFNHFNMAPPQSNWHTISYQDGQIRPSQNRPTSGVLRKDRPYYEH